MTMLLGVVASQHIVPLLQLPKTLKLVVLLPGSTALVAMRSRPLAAANSSIIISD